MRNALDFLDEETAETIVIAVDALLADLDKRNEVNRVVPSLSLRRSWQQIVARAFIRRIVYHSLAEMRALRDEIRRELGLAHGS